MTLRTTRRDFLKRSVAAAGAAAVAQHFAAPYVMADPRQARSWASPWSAAAAWAAMPSDRPATNGLSPWSRSTTAASPKS